MASLQASRHGIDPARAASVHTFRVRFCETDLMGIVHHASYLAYLEEGRVEWLRKRGVTYADWAARGVHLPVVEVRTRYRSPARFDDRLAVETRVETIEPYSVTFGYKVRRDDTVLVTATTKLACVDGRHRLARLSPAMRDVLLSGELPPP
ncbi:MAG: acyl-CoA thioesterase [Myxococcales bacterium]|nr:acyl-CoA thioesterase [Myxococcales bacterium]